MAGTNTTRMLLVTANIASCFEQPDIMLMPWINEFLKTITQLEPRFIALHCQEVGGKNYESSMQHVEHFVRYNKVAFYILFDHIAVVPPHEDMFLMLWD
ncbi:inositol polyphosphate-5-phosphatase A [Oratosquilla oratoria]|uniref:inositol polyphosphate-5-phosphatase A n=1 Tax=Oratosquilla oratoria TaxID=337810 RepID=UPI003F76F7FE